MRSQAWLEVQASAALWQIVVRWVGSLRGRKNCIRHLWLHVRDLSGGRTNVDVSGIDAAIFNGSGVSRRPFIESFNIASVSTGGSVSTLCSKGRSLDVLKAAPRSSLFGMAVLARTPQLSRTPGSTRPHMTDNI